MPVQQKENQNKVSSSQWLLALDLQNICDTEFQHLLKNLKDTHFYQNFWFLWNLK